jgi:hypothetical protein
MSEYNRRNALRGYYPRHVLVRELGFPSYAEYLKSEKWAEIRSAVLNENSDCRVCRRPANQVHHLKYTKANLSGENRDDLVGICKECHFLVEYDEDGDKRTIGEARKAFHKMARRYR